MNRSSRLNLSRPLITKCSKWSKNLSIFISSILILNRPNKPKSPTTRTGSKIQSSWQSRHSTVRQWLNATSSYLILVAQKADKKGKISSNRRMVISQISTRKSNILRQRAAIKWPCSSVLRIKMQLPDLTILELHIQPTEIQLTSSTRYPVRNFSRAKSTLPHP